MKKFEIGDKYFFEDIGLRNCQVGFSMQRDIQKLLENAVYLHLKNLQYDVFVGKKENLEIDFVGIKQGKKIYVQVAYLIADEQTQKREFGNLQAIADNYPKYVVSLDEFFMESNIGGIKHLNISDFLTRNDFE